MPMPSTALRRAIDQWFLVNGIQPRIKAEFDDGALMKVFGQSAAGVFPSATTIEKQICAQYNVSVVGRIRDISEKFYIITPERKIRHPALLSLYDKARGKFFS